MKILQFTAILLVTLAFGCNGAGKSDEKKDEGFVIEGKIENGRGMVVQLTRLGMNGKVAIGSDTADLTGNFRITGFEREKFIAVLSYDLSKNIFLVIDTTSKIRVDIPALQYENYKITGSPESQEFKSIKDVETSYGDMLVNLRLDFQNTAEKDEKTRDRLRNEYAALTKKSEDAYLELMRKSKSPLVQLFGLYSMQLEFDDELKKQMYDEIKKKNVQNEVAIAFARDYEASLATAVGAQTPEISLADTAGTAIALSSFKGKVVLIDFWASWCGPCRQENPSVVKLYNTYKSKGFEIFGVSLDNDMLKWKQAIGADGITWPQVSDLQGWQSAAATRYAVRSIPSTFLLDRNGVVVARNLRGAALEKKLQQILN